jgi:shikimate dehydrogenase/3-dehydroquinate dehydratase type I
MIVATLLEPRLAAIQEAIAACDATADAFEIRLDALKEPTDPGEIRNLTSKPLIAAIRRPSDGGQRPVSAEDRGRLLRECALVGFDYVDLETDDAPIPQARKTIRAHHDQRATPASASLVRIAQETPKEAVFKFAAKIRNFSDTLQLLVAARMLQQQGRTHALMGLGEFPRAITHLLGAHLLYGGGRTNAPGQPGHADIARTLAHWGSPRPAPVLYAVVGDPIDHSLSPRMHNAGFAAIRRDAAYGALRVTNHVELQMLLDRAGALGLAGLSVTSPLKDAAYELCAERAPEAEAARAVNCIRIDKGVATGHNTDGTAAADVSRRLVNDDARILVVGTGGAARALASQWPQERVTIAGRSPDVLRQIAKRNGCKAIPMGLAAHEMAEADLVVNANRELEPLPLADYDGAVFDFHYGAQPTPWQLHAQEKGLAFAGGHDLLLEQGVRAFRLWTGEDPPADLMRAALEAKP